MFNKILTGFANELCKACFFYKMETLIFFENKGGRRGGIRTPNRRIWSPLLYQLELHARKKLKNKALITIKRQGCIF